ncbi:efflux RND transporter periplasmic adaptor subunit [Allorhodopirellula solitaria]|nr:efflux RND transporter periplasmic adaptor subunit [Allorhodopirellula solitaria]
MLKTPAPTPMTDRQSRQTQKSIVTVLSVCLTAFLLGGLVCYLAMSGFKDSAEASAASGPAVGKPRGPQAQLVRVGSVQRKPILPTKTLVGDLVAVRSATVATEVAGKVLILPVDEGSRVTGGETLLARMDDTWLKLEEEKITTQIAEKKATLSFEKSDLERFEKLFQGSAMSASEVEQKRSLIEGHEASLANLRVLLDEANKRNERLEIFAPFDGSVVAKHAEMGEYLPIGSPIVDVVSTGRIDARIMVPEESLPLLHIGDSVDLLVAGLNMELQGKVFSINAQGSVGSRTFPVRIELDDQDGQLLPGMGVSVFVPVRKESTELLVPRDAVLTEPDESTIWILQPNSKTGVQPVANSRQPDKGPSLVAQPIPVRVLSHTRESYAIACVREQDRERVREGVQVVTEGLERLIPGATVRIDDDRSELSAVPGTYRTGQQVVD